MPLGKNLPKVTEYVKNVGKSIGYAAVDYIGNSDSGVMSNTADFIETNQELFKDIYSAARNYRRTMKAADRSIRQSKVYEAGVELKKTLFDSIRTGKFYDPEREAYYQSKAGGDMASMDDMDDWGFNSGEYDIDSGDDGFESSDQAKATNIVTGAVRDATTAQANIIAKSTEYLAETNKASTRLLFTQGEKLYANVVSGFANTQSMLDRMNSFLAGPLTTHMENSRTFFQETTNKLATIEAYLKESTEMQRNLYKKEQESYYKQSSLSKVGTSSPDLKDYFKEVYKNFKDVLPPEAQILFGNDMGEGANMLLAMVDNPLKFIPNAIVTTLVPATIKKSLETLDNSFSSLFSNMIAKLNRASGDMSNAPGWLRMLGKIFGLKMDTKSTVDPSKYEKGPVAFDGITKKAIVDVIPGHLSRIEAALTGRTERVFDFETGKWVNADEIERQFKSRKSRAVSDAAWDVSDEIRSYIYELKKTNEQAAKDMEKSVYKLFKKIYDDGGAFDPYRPHGFGDDKEDPWDYYDMDKTEFLKIARMITKDRKAAMNLAASMMDSKESYARYMRELEAKGTGASRVLFNNSYKYNTYGDSIVGGNGTGMTNIIRDATDEYNKNIFYYLRGIYAELVAKGSGRRRSGGSGGGGGGGGPRGGGPTGPVNPRQLLEERLSTEISIRTSTRSTYSRTYSADEQDVITIIQSLRQSGMTDDQIKEWLKMNGYKFSDNLFNDADDDTMSEDDFYQNWQERETARRETERLKREKDKNTAPFLDQLLQASTLGAKFRVITANINELLKKPGLAIAGVIDKADQRIFELVFGNKEGQEIGDGDGRTFKGTLNYMIIRIRETFDKMNDWIDENILEPLKKKLGVNSIGEFFKNLADKMGLTKAWNKVKEWSAPVRDRVREKLGFGWKSFKSSVNNTYGAGANWAASKLNNLDAQIMGKPNSEELKMYVDSLRKNGMPDDEILEWLTSNGYMASGGLVTRRGLAIISPGEKVVPVGGKQTQRNMLTEERAFARRNGIRGANFYATGNGPEMDEKTVRNATEKVIDEVVNDTKHKGIANVIASSLIGGGASLITGMVGGPILGAAAGAAFGIAQNSQTVQTILFGEEVTDSQGNKHRTGGIFSRDFQEKFKKYFPSMKDFGIAGGIAGLFTPLGIVGGIMAGSAIGFLKENDHFKEWLFGKKDQNGDRDGGLIKKAFRDKLKKAAPSMLVGAVGGALLGPFGIMGNALLGSALGFVSTTDKFREVVFGKKDSDGKRKGGMVGALYKGLVKPMLAAGGRLIKSVHTFVSERILKPLNDFVNPMVQMIKNGITSITDFIKDRSEKALDKYIGQPIYDFLHHKIFDNVAKWTKRILFLPAKLAKGVVSAPFQALGFIGNNIRMSQIAKGTASDMTAAQRLQFRKDHPNRVFGKELIGHDTFRNLDEKLAGLKGQAGVDRMKEMRDQMKIYLDTKGEVGKQVADLVKKAGEITSDFFNNSYNDDSPEVSAYTQIGYGRMKKLHEAIAEGDIRKMKRITGMWVLKGYITRQQEAEYYSKISDIVEKIREAIVRKKNARQYQKELQGKLGMRTGGALGNSRNIRRFSRMLDNEIDAREAEIAKEKAENPEQAAADSINAVIDRNTQSIVDILKSINRNLDIVSGRTTLADETSDDTAPQDERIEDDGTFDSEGDMNNLDQQHRNSSFATRQRSRGGLLRRATRKVKGLGKAFRGGMQTGSNAANDTIDSVGGAIVGKATTISRLFKGSYHIEKTEDGKSVIVDENGRPVPGSRGANSYKQEMKQKREEKRSRMSFLQKASDSLGHISGAIIGGAGKLIGKAKDGIFSLVSGIANHTGFFGKLLKGLGGAGLLAIGVAGAGHFSELWKEKLWPTVKEWGGKIWNGISSTVSKVWNWLEDKFPKIFGEDGVFGKIRKKVEEVVDSVKNGTFLDGVLNWIKSGWTKFADNIVIPLMDKIAPRLSLAIYNGIHGSKDNLVNAIEGKSVSDTTVQKVDSSGNKLYKDNLTGKETTSATDANGNANEAVMSDVTVGVTEYKTGGLNWIRNQDWGTGARKTRKTVKMNGDTFEYIEYTNGTIIIRDESSSEYIRLNNGIKSRKMTVGALLDEKGNVSNASILSGLAIGGLIGNIAGTAIGAVAGAKAGAAVGGLAGSVIPGIGNVVGAAVGTVVGAAAGVATSYFIYKMQGGGYCKEQDVQTNSDAAALIAAKFGLDLGTGNWPAFSEDTSGSSNIKNTDEFKRATDNTSGSGRSLTRIASQSNKYNGVAARARHIYQNDPSIANQRFGNSTFGDAGCGPVAATNLMNQLSGGGNLGMAADMATGYQTADGGTTPDYFRDLLNATGYGGTETNDKSSMMNAIKNGRPTVLLGKSGREQGTPFGSNNHYINAMGMDRNGNMIVEDPDLPGSSYKYPASKVMNDTITGVMTGYARNRRKQKFYGFQKRSGLSRSGRAKTITVYRMTERALSIIAANEGNYSSVNRTDGKSFSVGIIQWNGTRAISLIGAIINSMGRDEAVGYLGESLYNSFTTRSSSMLRHLTTDEKAKVSALVGSEKGIECQNALLMQDINSYINHGMKLGLTDEDALIYFADLENQGGGGASARVYKAAKSPVTLDTIHAAALMDNVMGASAYVGRRNKTYNAIKSSKKVGTGTIDVDISALGDLSSNIQSSVAAASSAENDNSLTGILTTAFQKIFTSIYGEDAANFLGFGFGNSSSETISGGDFSSTGSFGSGSGNGTQKSLVDNMKSIKGRIKYSLTGPQDPDKGSASCASTVAWAYKKAFGSNSSFASTPMSASSTTQSKDSRFNTIWTNDGTPLDKSILQPGDIMYYNWNQTRNNGNMQHTEMYGGNGIDYNHGGPGLGTTERQLTDERMKNLMMVRRYKGFTYNGTTDANGNHLGARGRSLAGYARVNDGISDKTKGIINKYGISTGSNTPRYGNVQAVSDAAYNSFLSVIIDLLAMIADNTEGLAQLQKVMAEHGMNVDTTTLQRAAGNARKRVGRARKMQQNHTSPNFQGNFDAADMQDLMNSPTGYMVKAMEILATE